MSLSIPIWFCIVKSEPVTPQGHHAYRIIQAIKCQWDELDWLYREYQSAYYTNIGCTTMIFTRETDETPMKDMSLYPQELGSMIGDMSKELGVLKTTLEQEIKWKDQLAEDNRILRETLKVQDSYFKYGELEEKKEFPEYKDW